MSENTVQIPETGSITFPITANYAPDWGPWEIVRELVYQEAMDNYRRFSIRHEKRGKKTWTVAQMWEPKNGFLTPRHFLFGVGDKGKDARGQFHEGIKLAVLALLRRKINFYICSGPVLFTASMVQLLGEEVLQIKWEPAYFDEALLPMTEVGFASHFPDFSQRIVADLTDPKILFVASNGDQILKVVNLEPALYVKDIYVCPLSHVTSSRQSSFSYNLQGLQIDRDRRMARNQDVLVAIGDLWVQVDNPTLWSTFFKAVVAGAEQEKVLERELHLSRLQHLEKAREGWNKATGSKKYARSTRSAHTTAVKQLNHEVVYLPWNLNALEAVIPSDADVVREHEHDHREQPALPMGSPELYGHIDYLLRRMEKRDWRLEVFEMLVPEVRVLRNENLVQLPLEWLNFEKQEDLLYHLLRELNKVSWGVNEDSALRCAVRALALKPVEIDLIMEEA